MPDLKQKKILMPTRCVDDWKDLLAEPEKHWKPGCSAMLTADSWEHASGLPPEIVKLFVSSLEDRFRNVELALAIPEYKVPLKGGSRPSQSDVFALLTFEEGLIAVAVEAKASEDFGPTLGQWQATVSEKGYLTRLDYILKNIGLSQNIPANIRYQLLHRTASAMIEAKRFHAKTAAMIVQSFVNKDLENHFKDYARFLGLYAKTPTKDRLILLKEIDGIRLYSAWVYTKPFCS